MRMRERSVEEVLRNPRLGTVIASTPELKGTVRRILEEVRNAGEPALRRYAERLDGLPPDAALLLDREELQADFESLCVEQQELLKRVAQRIERFAVCQSESLRRVEVEVAGGTAGQRVTPVAAAGCYAPGGRYPLPSSVLMTAVTARVAGVPQVVVASPNPTQMMRAAAYVSGADAFLRAGGAQAIAALAYGVAGIPHCSVIVGPGNEYVTQAKAEVAGSVRIDNLAGPSELLVVADDSASPEFVAADLIAQAEHDVRALPMLITRSREFAARVEDELSRQLSSLPTAQVARAALRNGFRCVAGCTDQIVQLCDAIAPEHLQLTHAESQELAARVSHFGALFLGEGTPEVLADYGVGPNHVLPTGGAARASGGLSVLDFLRVQSWVRLEDPDPGQVTDAVAFARAEGLEGHARAAQLRI